MSKDRLPPPSVDPVMMKRCKLFWRFLMVSNFALGAYIFVSKRKEPMEINGRTAHKLKKDKTIVEVPPEPIPSSMEDLNYEDFISPIAGPVQVRTRIPEEQQKTN